MCSDIILVGSGGCMRELAWQIQELNKEKQTWNVLGYVDNVPPAKGSSVCVGTQELLYLGNDDYLLGRKEQTNIAICVGSPSLRKKIAFKLLHNPCIQFPNLILSNTKISTDIKLGKGCIISMDARVSTNVVIGDFVFINTGSMVCHDGRISDYVSLGPDVKLAGAVSVGMNSELGISTKVIQGVKIADYVITGAGTAVVRNLERAGTYVGVPAHQIR